MRRFRCPGALALLLAMLPPVFGDTLPPTGRQVRSEPVTGRRYILYVPAGYDPGRVYPLIVSSHGTGQNGDTEMDGTGPNSCCDRGTPTWPTLAEANNVIVACPDMTGAYGSANNQLAAGQLVQLAADETAILRIVAEIRAAYSIDSRRLLMTGFSGGGHVAHYVGLRHPELFTALCARHGNFNVEAAPAPLPNGITLMPVYLFSGANDPVYGTREAIAWYTAQGFARLDTDSFTAAPSSEHTTDRHHALSWFVGLPLLAASPDGHYISYQGRPLMLVGESGTQVILQNANVDYRRWIDDCAARGIRAVHVWGFVPPRQKQDGSRVEARYGYVYPGLTPWARRVSGPDGTDQLKQWDLQAFDEGADGDATHYWSRLRDLCGYAAGRRILVGITVFFGWPKHNSAARPDWSYHPLNVVNGGPVTDTGDPVTEVQMIESPGTEVWPEAWSDAWPSRRKTQWIWERYARKLIESTQRYGNVFFVFMDEHSYSEGNMGDHFRDFFRSRGQLWIDWDARRAGVDAVVSGSLGGDDKNAAAVGGFNAVPARPYCLLEGDPYQGSAVRTAIWTFCTGGAHYFFHGDEGQETATTGVMAYDPHVAGGDTGAYKRDWVGHASRFFNEHVAQLDRLAPHNELAGPGTCCLADPGREYVVYSRLAAPAVFNLDLRDQSGIFDSRFFSPRTGEFTAAAKHLGGRQLAFTKPDAEDWALHVLVSVKSVPGDFDLDLDVDQEDFGRFQACYSGSGHAADAGCELAVLDGDGDVDADDFRIFLACLSGADTPADPGCGAR